MVPCKHMSPCRYLGYMLEQAQSQTAGPCACMLHGLPSGLTGMSKGSPAGGSKGCMQTGCLLSKLSETRQHCMAQVKIAVSGKNLAVAETSGYQPPDPFAVLCVTDARGAWEETSRTEVLENNRGALSALLLALCFWHQP